MTPWSLPGYTRALDETDLHILELLVEDARRPFSDISAKVGLSALAVSDRIDRPREGGIIRRSTADLNQSTLSGGTPIPVKLSVRPEFVDEVRDVLHTTDPIQRLSIAADGEATTHTRLDGGSTRAQLDELVNLPRIRGHEVNLVESVEWSPTVNGTGFALECVECDNTVTSEGESVHAGGSPYHSCYSSCLGRLEDRYDCPEAGVNDD